MHKKWHHLSCIFCMVQIRKYWKQRHYEITLSVSIRSSIYWVPTMSQVLYWGYRNGWHIIEVGESLFLSKLAFVVGCRCTVWSSAVIKAFARQGGRPRCLCWRGGNARVGRKGLSEVNFIVRDHGREGFVCQGVQGFGLCFVGLRCSAWPLWKTCFKRL